LSNHVDPTNFSAVKNKRKLALRCMKRSYAKKELEQKPAKHVLSKYRLMQRSVIESITRKAIKLIHGASWSQWIN
jgi:hypothetical protein